jgi:hypothetical protein
MIGAADNDLVVKINGQEVHKGGLGDIVKTKRFENRLKNGEHLIEIEAINGESPQRNPAGLIAQFEIVAVAPDTQAETMFRFSTDDQWEASQEGKTWQAAQILGDFGMSPWIVAVSSGDSDVPLYPDYEFTANILKEKGINVDFDATDKGLRFYHRREGKTDYYFVGNKSNTPFHGEVSFRIADKQASIWDPMTGRVFQTPPTKTENGMTSFVLDLEGSQSVFVVFDDKGADSKSVVWQSHPQALVAELPDGWEVRFDPARGGPATPVKLQKLLDWTTSDNDGIKYYSGIATYTNTFTVPANSIEQGKRYWLDLGEVEVMARVKLNGKNIGTRWIAPYRLEMTDAIQKGENVLEIEVANLWANRLIGDAALPEEKRTTWTTLTNAYKANSPLLPSGLIGPVRILVGQ